MLYLPPDKNVTGFLASEVVIVLQDDLVCVPHYHSKLISGRRKGDKEVRHRGRRERGDAARNQGQALRWQGTAHRDLI